MGNKAGGGGERIGCSMGGKVKDGEKGQEDSAGKGGVTLRKVEELNLYKGLGFGVVSRNSSSDICGRKIT